MISRFANPGNACQRQATRPAIFGLENDVPLPVPMLPSGPAIVVPSPTETTFGFISPDEFGPQLENGAINPFTSVAPTVRELSASPGQATYFDSSVASPEFPALAVTIIPLATA